MDPFPISHCNCDWFAALQGIGNMDPFPWKTQRGILMSPYDYLFATPPEIEITDPLLHGIILYEKYTYNL